MQLLAWILGGIIALVVMGPIAIAVLPLGWVLLKLYQRHSVERERETILVSLDRLSRKAGANGSSALQAMFEELQKLVREDPIKYLQAVRVLGLDIEEFNVDAMRAFLASRGRAVCDACHEVHSGVGCAARVVPEAPRDAVPVVRALTVGATNSQQSGSSSNAADELKKAIRPTRCQSCTSFNEADAHFCTTCGTRLQGMPSNSNMTPIECPGCGLVNAPTAMNCDCGRTLAPPPKRTG